MALRIHEQIKALQALYDSLLVE